VIKKNQNSKVKLSVKVFDRIKQLLNHGTIYDLGQPYHVGMPHYPLHPPFAFSLARKHGDAVYGENVSAAAEIYTTGGHTGTHLDSLGHISIDGRLFSGIEASKVQDYPTGLKKRGIDETPPIMGRGLLLDIAGLKGVEALAGGYTVTPDDFKEALAQHALKIDEGDTILVRTGWAKYWNKPELFISNPEGAPGPGLEAAIWLASKKIRFVGSDTVAFEKMPSHLPVHGFLIAEKGIQIIEMLNLENLSEDNIHEFVFTALPLRIIGGTASPIRPIAIV
jgi:kynurenine formamidase